MEHTNNSISTKQEIPENINKSNQKFKILIFSLIFTIIIIIGLLIGIIILAVKKKEEVKTEDNEDKSKENEQSVNPLPSQSQQPEMYEKAGYLEPWYDLYGNKTINISYAENNLILNSYKIGGSNYKEEIGNLNNGNDYHKNERNVYDLYIPYSSLKKKNKHNGIILMIHGGSWIQGKKEDVEAFASRYAKQGYITATIGYTVLSDEYTEYNIFRIMDEITACIKSIKKELKSQEFNENKMELAIGGVSAGAHLALLYAYTNKDKIIPIKFLINVVGPVTLEIPYWYTPSVNNDTLENIEDKNVVENAIKDGKLKRIFDNEYLWLYVMNLFLGKKYNAIELLRMMNGNGIKTNDAKYIEMFTIAKNAIPIYFIEDNPIPVLCEYGGNDSVVGVAQYCYLKEKYEQKGGVIDLVYMRYAGHEVYHHDTEQGIIAMKEMNYKILDFANKYFTND